MTGNEKLPKDKQVWREVFPPNVGDWVKFTRQWRGTHRKFYGLVEKRFLSTKGFPIYMIKVKEMVPKKPYEGTPSYLSLKGNSRIERVDKDEVKT